MAITYEDMAERLTPEASWLFREMVAAHVEAGGGERLFMELHTLAGTELIFASTTSTNRSWPDVDVGALHDLADYGLLRRGYGGRGTPNYRLTGEAIRFHRWLMARIGTAVDQVEEAVRRVTEGERFAARHAGAAHHLGGAFSLLWTDSDDDQTVSEIGDHLRKALMDTTSDVVGDAGGLQEQPIKRLKAYLATSMLSEREAAVLTQLVELASAALRLDHRLNHVRDEVDKGELRPTWEEMRRAAFTTAFVCHELDRL